MAGASSRRPIPALVFLLALSLLSGLVWWRVLNRDDSSANSPSTPASTSTCAQPTTKAVALPKPTSVTVDVLNATNTNRLAATVTGLLTARGFKAGVPDTDSIKSTLSYIRYGPKAAAAARLLQIYVPHSALTPNTSTSAVIVLSVGASFKTLNSTAVVAQAVAAASHVVVKAC